MDPGKRREVLASIPPHVHQAEVGENFAASLLSGGGFAKDVEARFLETRRDLVELIQRTGSVAVPAAIATNQQLDNFWSALKVIDSDPARREAAIADLARAIEALRQD